MGFLLLLPIYAVFSLAVDGVHAYKNANILCTNDCERMFCQLELINCTEYKLTLVNTRGQKFGDESCILQDCGHERCCCNMKMELIFGEAHIASVWKGDERINSTEIGVIKSFKPKTPTIISVSENNGNFRVNWRTNIDDSSISLTAERTYYKKGGLEKPWTSFSPASAGGLLYFEISGEDLETSTTYVVRVRSVADLNGAPSDSSKEWEIETPASGNALFSVIIIILSVAAIIISVAMYYCYVKLKSNWWDKLPNPKMIIVHPIKEMMLQPEKPWPSPVVIEQRSPDEDKQWSPVLYTDIQCSGSDCSSTGSSHVSYADTPMDITMTIAYNLSKIFPKISQVSPLPNSPCMSKDSGLFSAPFSQHENRRDGSTSGSSDLVNPSYSLLIPNSSKNVSPDSSENLSPLLPVDPYQQHNADTQRFSYAEDPSSSSISSGADTTASCEHESQFESSPPASTFSSVPNRNPVHGFKLPESHVSVVEVEDDYQPVQNLVAQPDVLFSEERGDAQEGDLVKYQEKLFSQIPQSCFNSFHQGVSGDAPRGLHQQALQAPFLFVMPAGNCMPVSTESDYHSV